MTVTVDSITLQLAFQRLEFETGFDVNALIDERDRLKAALKLIRQRYFPVGDEMRVAWATDTFRIARDATHPYCSNECDCAPGHPGPCGTFAGSGHP